MYLTEIGLIVKIRREELGISQYRLATFCGIHTEILSKLEAGELNDIGFCLLQKILATVGLSFDQPNSNARKSKRGMWMAAKTSSVSYKNDLSPADLRFFLESGTIDSRYFSNIVHFMEDAPIELIVMAVEETSGIPSLIWEKLEHTARQLGIQRDCWK